ncbi:MAG TPA: hypothetical protein PKD64_15580 [Pirellulaceae bacterium]|nr:hypothetical protein [Pirellulaceae bacterium]HMO93607.1 hypothetical protein [Pirellulaceae bacterium]HMP70531.1 hypothetical protein [Pirellulaceae bacterium]
MIRNLTLGLSGMLAFGLVLVFSANNVSAQCCGGGYSGYTGYSGYPGYSAPVYQSGCCNTYQRPVVVRRAWNNNNCCPTPCYTNQCYTPTYSHCGTNQCYTGCNPCQTNYAPRRSYVVSRRHNNCCNVNCNTCCATYAPQTSYIASHGCNTGCYSGWNQGCGVNYVSTNYASGCNSCGGVYYTSGMSYGGCGQINYGCSGCAGQVMQGEMGPSFMDGVVPADSQLHESATPPNPNDT